MRVLTFEHNRFNNKINGGWIAKDIIKNKEKGSATADKIVTVLDKIHKIENISVLKRISNNVIKNYENYLIKAVNNKELKPHTVQGYASTLNAVVNYINLRTDKNLQEISLAMAGIKNISEYPDKSTPQPLFDKVRDKVSEAQQVKLDLQRTVHLRVQESHYIKKLTIENALATGVLKLNQQNNDGTKNSRARDEKVLTQKQKNVLIRTLNYMNKTGQKSLIENDKTYKQASDKYYRDMAKAGGTRKNNAGHNFSHGNRHFSLQQLYKLTGSKSIVSSEAGHGETRTTDVYLGKN